MSHIVTWEYYSSLSSKLSKEEFEKIVVKAEKEVKSVIGPIKWAQITEKTFGYDVLKDCICNTVDKIIDDCNSGKGKGISSVSNDGYSETYSVETEAQLRNELQSSIKAWLSGTGLVGAY